MAPTNHPLLAHLAFAGLICCAVAVPAVAALPMGLDGLLGSAGSVSGTVDASAPLSAAQAAASAPASGPIVDQTVATPLGAIHADAADLGSGSIANVGTDLATPAVPPLPVPLPVPLPIDPSGQVHAQAHAGLDGASADAGAQAAGVSVDESAHADAGPLAQFFGWVASLF